MHEAFGSIGLQKKGVAITYGNKTKEVNMTIQ